MLIVLFRLCQKARPMGSFWSSYYFLLYNHQLIVLKNTHLFSYISGGQKSKINFTSPSWDANRAALPPKGHRIHFLGFSSFSRLPTFLDWWPLSSSKPAMAGGLFSHNITLTATLRSPSSPFKLNLYFLTIGLTEIWTWGPLRWSSLISFSQGQLIRNPTSIYNLNSFSCWVV